MKIIAVDQKKRMKRNENSLRDPWGNIKQNNIHIIGVQEGEERQRVRIILHIHHWKDCPETKLIRKERS